MRCGMGWWNGKSGREFARGKASPLSLLRNGAITAIITTSNSYRVVSLARSGTFGSYKHTPALGVFHWEWNSVSGAAFETQLRIHFVLLSKWFGWFFSLCFGLLKFEWNLCILSSFHSWLKFQLIIYLAQALLYLEFANALSISRLNSPCGSEVLDTVPSRQSILFIWAKWNGRIRLQIS